MMVHITKTHIVLCLMIFHSSKSKHDLIFDLAHQNNWKALSSSNSYTLTHQKQIYNQLHSSEKMMVQVTKTPIILCLMIFHSTKMKNYLIFGFSTSKQLENTLFHWFICSHTPETNSQPTLQQWQNDGSSNKNTYCFMFDDLPLNQKQKWLIFGFSTSKQLENNLFQ